MQVSPLSYIINRDGALAQLGARHTGSVEVVGSNPICSIMKSMSLWRWAFLLSQSHAKVICHLLTPHGAGTDRVEAGLPLSQGQRQHKTAFYLKANAAPAEPEKREEN